MLIGQQSPWKQSRNSCTTRVFFATVRITGTCRRGCGENNTTWRESTKLRACLFFSPLPRRIDRIGAYITRGNRDENVAHARASRSGIKVRGARVIGRGASDRLIISCFVRKSAHADGGEGKMTTPTPHGSRCDRAVDGWFTAQSVFDGRFFFREGCAEPQAFFLIDFIDSAVFNENIRTSDVWSLDSVFKTRKFKSQIIVHFFGLNSCFKSWNEYEREIVARKLQF